MQTRFLLGPAGSGKTFRCLAEIRAALRASQEGDPLIFLAPKQATFQLERQLLADPSLPGYTRLSILSFERLADFVLEQLHRPPPSLLTDEGRLMVLRALLSQKRSELKLFRASARLPGFAQQLNRLLRELQRYHLTADRLEKLAQQVGSHESLRDKLHDLALLLRAYLDWLKAHGLQDGDCLLDVATEALASDKSPLRIQNLWLDGFAEMTPQELDLLAGVLPRCERATLAFCLENESTQSVSWLSPWSVVSQTFSNCFAELKAIPNCDVTVEVLDRQPAQSRFAASPVLQHLEKCWAKPEPFPGGTTSTSSLTASADKEQIGDAVERVPPPPEDALRMVACANPEAEATFAAREILRHVRDRNGRFRDCAVLLRSLKGYDDLLRRVFTRYEIPFFLDRREPVAHHPLAELTRFALRTVAFDWKQEDWFGALKTGLVHDDEEAIDRLENEALAYGWKGEVWLQPLVVPKESKPAGDRERLREKIVPPLEQLAKRTGTPLAGAELAVVLREFWRQLGIEQRLEAWAAAADPASDLRLPTSVHATVWDQLQAWLENLERAFPTEALPLRDWLPILEAGLANLTVGIIPPSLDQVLIGTVDRSRNPDLQFVLLLGMNESVFPAVPAPDNLLTDSEREILAQHQATLGLSQRMQLGHERYYGYIACTRARQRLLLTFSERDANDKPLNPSPFIGHLQRLFSKLEIEADAAVRDWTASEHVSELIAPLVRFQISNSEFQIADSIPALAPIAERLRHLRVVDKSESLSPELAERLYGPVLRTSVSRLEQFAACPFKFFVNSGMRAEERKLFEVDARERGSFQHEVLARFHEAVRAQNREWRDLSPQESSDLIGRIAEELAADFRDGLFKVDDKSLFTAQALTVALQKFISTIIAWMQHYEFNPRAVELAFGESGAPLPAWEIDLGDGHRMAFRGKIDRVDLAVNRERDEALCVVMDYKSGAKKIDPVLLANGIQIQLPAYLAALRQLADPRPVFGVARLIPAGVFYVNLRGQYERGQSRREVLEAADAARQRAYRHAGRFSLDALPLLDRGYREKPSGQFNFKLKKDNQSSKQIKDLLEAGEFSALLDGVEEQLRAMGQKIFEGVAEVKPYRKGSETACDQCDYRAICRIDPWTDEFRTLRLSEM
ncbi:MAG: PD-(D/E)XK nuclease family protein [Verrucomicrobia bacterium]|nr:PD-(D/E)XK nuclease family protein [Verrucomicrobiota bacterium]